MGGRHRQFARTCLAQYGQYGVQYMGHQRNYTSRGMIAIGHTLEQLMHGRSQDEQIHPGNDW